MFEDYLLKIDALKVDYYTSKGVIRAIDGAEFAMRRGEVIGLVGESGSGKSTIALSILRLLPQNGRIRGGEIWFEGENLLEKDEEYLRKIRGKKISLIFQEPMSSLNPVQKVGKQVEEMVKLHQTVSKDRARDIVVRLFKEIKLPDPENFFERYPHELSGGMKQRVMIAMAISCEPDLLIADEPTSALDVTIQAQILALMVHLIRKKGISVLFITHNLAIVAQICDEVVVMYAGKVAEIGRVNTIFNHSLHPYTQGLLQSTPRIDKNHQYLRPIKGDLPDSTISSGCPFMSRCYKMDKVCKEKNPILREVGPNHWVSCWRS